MKSHTLGTTSSIAESSNGGAKHSSWSANLSCAAKSLIFPGVNLHTRDRYTRVPRFFRDDVGPGKLVLDVGCGNGMLAYSAWKRGAKVLGISIKEREVRGCRAMFNRWKGIPESALRFEAMNIAEFGSDQVFDAVICAEVLEHISDDAAVARRFFELVRPGGCLHITTPNADHPYNKSFPLDKEGKGGHVRAGYTAHSYAALFEPLGFVIEEVIGLGGPVRQAFSRRIKDVQSSFGPAAGVPLFALSLPFLWMDSATPAMPFSLYARVRRPILTDRGDAGVSLWERRR